ncbi:hypothetical protein Tco_0222820 [Tanacetum coccineum]
MQLTHAAYLLPYLFTCWSDLRGEKCWWTGDGSSKVCSNGAGSVSGISVGEGVGMGAGIGGGDCTGGDDVDGTGGVG